MAGLIALAAGIGGIIAFPSLRPGLRAALAFSFGVPALVNGAMHAGHLGAGGPPGGDVTGIAAAIPWRRRGSGTWRARAVAVPGGLAACLFLLGPVALGVVATHKWREPVGSPPSAAYAVVVVHGGSSDRKGSVAHAEMLARHGYGVLLYDARGRGESEDSENNYGGDWGKDIAGALDFLRARVDPDRVGAVGLSTGADALIDLGPDVAALVTDGAAASSYEDWDRLRGRELGAVPGRAMFTTVRVLSGDPPTRPLEDRVREIDAPALLISAGTDVERDFNDLYDAAAGGSVEHWNLPDASHTRAIRQHRSEYERRVVSFLDAALGP